MQNGNNPGALIIGGQRPGLGIARSLGRRDPRQCPRRPALRFALLPVPVERVVRVKDLRSDRATIDALLEMGRTFDMNGWVLFPTRDEHVNAIARNRDEFVEAVPGDHAGVGHREVGVGQDQLVCSRRAAWYSNAADVVGDESSGTRSFLPRLPLAIKPAVKEHFFFATGAKAWRVETSNSCATCTDKAACQIDLQQILHYFRKSSRAMATNSSSFCAFCRQGGCTAAPGRPSTRAGSSPRIWTGSRRRRRARERRGRGDLRSVFSSTSHMTDWWRNRVQARSARRPDCRFLDVNARTWGFHTFRVPAGVDFASYKVCGCRSVCRSSEAADNRASLVGLSTDLPTALADIASPAI